MKKHAVGRKPLQALKPARGGRKSTRNERVITRVRSGKQMVKLIRERKLDTVEAEEWAVRAISPCDERVQNGRQIPDGSSAPSAVITSRILTVIEPPATVGSEKLWNCQFVVAPLPDVAFVYKKWTSAQTNKDVPWVPVTYDNVRFGSLQFPADPTIANPNPPDVALNPGGVGRNIGTLLTNAEQTRQTMKGLTIELNASALHNGGMVLAGQYGDKITRVVNTILSPKTGYATPDYDKIPASCKGAAYVVQNVPSNTEQLFDKDSLAVRMPARKGVYLPLKFNDAESPYAETDSNQYPSAEGPIPVMFQTKYDGFNQTQEFLPAPNGNFLGSAGLMNMQTGVVFFSGLELEASLDVKTVSALEVVPRSVGNWTGFSQESPENVPDAQRHVHEVQRKLASAHPASYNFLGTLLATVLPYLGDVAKAVVGGLVSRFTTRASRAAAVA